MKRGGLVGINTCGFVLAAILLFIGASFIDEVIQSFKDESYFKFGFFGILVLCCIAMLIKILI